MLETARFSTLTAILHCITHIICSFFSSQLCTSVHSLEIVRRRTGACKFVPIVIALAVILLVVILAIHEISAVDLPAISDGRSDMWLVEQTRGI